MGLGIPAAAANIEAPVRTFLSCSIRPRDASLVSTLVSKVLAPRGFRCLTIGRNLSLPEQVDDAVKRLVQSCECLIGVATERLEATDRDLASRTLKLTTPYILQETSMAFQQDLPFLIFKVPNVTLQGVTARNLYIEIEPALTPKGNVKFKTTQAALKSSLDDLKAKALARRQRRRLDGVKNAIGWASSAALALYLGKKGLDQILRPDCFGTYDSRDSICRGCSYKKDCKIQKWR